MQSICQTFCFWAPIKHILVYFDSHMHSGWCIVHCICQLLRSPVRLFCYANCNANKVHANFSGYCTVGFQVTVKNVGDVFLGHSVHLIYFRLDTRSAGKWIIPLYSPPHFVSCARRLRRLDVESSRLESPCCAEWKQAVRQLAYTELQQHPAAPTLSEMHLYYARRLQLAATAPRRLQLGLTHGVS